jgi:hypothetical protein
VASLAGVPRNAITTDAPRYGRRVFMPIVTLSWGVVCWMTIHAARTGDHFRGFAEKRSRTFFYITNILEGVRRT